MRGLVGAALVSRIVSLKRSADAVCTPTVTWHWHPATDLAQTQRRGTSNRFGSQASALVRAQQLGVRVESLEPVMLESRGIDWRGEDQIERVEDWRSGTREYDHDPRGRLIRERQASNSMGPNLALEESRERAMDAVSNVYRRPDGLDRNYEAGGRLKASSEARYEHDEDGNRIRKITPEGTWHYRWNGHGQLREVERPDGIRISFQYDAFARRIEKRVTSEGNAPSITEYAWDGHQLLHEIGPTGTVTWHWDPESFAPVMREENGRLASITTDHLGTPTEMYGEMGAPIWKARLDLFGVCTIERGTPAQCPFRWPGQYEDEETGLYYNRFRYYDPSEGVYVSQDPIRLAGGLALYGYVADPLCEFDPFGLNKALGDFGERVARRHAQGMGHTIVGSVQNTSGHGIDLVTRDPSGTLHFWEVKVNSARMSRAQSGGATFIRSRLENALSWKSTHHPRLAAQARELLDEIDGVKIRGTVLRVRPEASPSRRITSKKWCG